ncbi:type II secretion system F family protein (plasmid) [Stutzerimonas frequens]|uniref:type II secretion system F family protein n=1 Tax=Stutzerimonas frequens TaxID=2968969 RepID=UPI002DB83F09|nr:type II secretion system F family protein [Stutzerimonas frequens]WRW29469.1 type II secretion system F family protein [Stutzerimonas frequens]
MSSDIEFGGITSNADLRDVSFVFRNLYKNNVPAADVLYQTGKMIPKFKDILHAGSKQISSKGWSLSKALEQLFPPATMASIRAGEESGRLYQVFEQIWLTAKTQDEINKVLRGLIMPVVLMFVGIIVALVFYIFLVPVQFEKMARGAPAEYVPNAAITTALQLNKFVLENWQIIVFVLVFIVVFLAGLLSRRSIQNKIIDNVIKVMIAIKPIGVAYANLKFGVMASYLQIVSMAGLDADKRIDLVIDVLPVPLRKAIVLFRSEMINKGITVASEAEGRSDDDPRHSPIQWPYYIRLAFQQADEGSWEDPMREYGEVMLEDGKEKIKQHIATLQVISFAFVGLIIVIPVGLLYSTLGDVLTMRMRML